MKEYLHTNGLLIKLQENLDIEQTIDGFRITPFGYHELRKPFRIIVRLISQRPSGEWSTSHKINGYRIYYRLDSNISGGSGGEIWTLYAWRKYSKGFVSLEYLLQTEELTEPNFELGWEVMANLNVIEKEQQ